MKIVATPLPSGSAITLGDDSVGDFIVDPPPLPVERRQLQQEALAFAEREFATGRGNRRTGFSWTVARVHADQATATGFVWGHAAGVPMNCSLEVQEAEGAWSFSSAVIVEVAVIEQSGVSTKVRYTVQGAVPNSN
ncbi:MAG: hypothetical protein ABSF95_09390 [Verrucomicrobiota bacterium]|jgi:hypothetical protein